MQWLCRAHETSPLGALNQTVTPPTRRRRVPSRSKSTRSILAAFASGLALLSSIAAADPAISDLRATSRAFASVARDVSPAVVFIRVEQARRSQGGIPYGDDFFRRFFQSPGEPGNEHRSQPMQRGQGSGFIVSEDGIILTNNHVVGDADRVVVQLADGREFDARVIGTDPPTDVAVIKIDAEDLPTVELGSSGELQVGEWVLAIGNPFGLSHTLTVGVVSAKGRSSLGINDYENFIQTDAAINPGNSGGPLIDLDGKVVGINTAIFSRSGGYMGIGFAIPIDMARSIRQQLETNGQVQRGFLGVLIQDITQDLKAVFDLDDLNGVLVSEVFADSPAAEGGLKTGDVIIKLNDNEVHTVGNFRNQIAMTSPNTRIRLKVLRDGDEKNLTVEVGELDSTEVAMRPQQTDVRAALGLTVRAIGQDAAERLGLDVDRGVFVASVDPGGAAAEAGLRPGMVILEVDRQPVRTPREFQRAAHDAGDRVLLLVRDQGGTRFATINRK